MRSDQEVHAHSLHTISLIPVTATANQEEKKSIPVTITRFPRDSRLRLSRHPSSKMKRKSITNYSSIRNPVFNHRVRSFPAYDNFSTETIARAPVPAVLPRGQTRTRRSDPVGHSAAALSNPRRRWRTVDGERDQRPGVRARTAGGAANGHIRTQSGRKVSVCFLSLFSCGCCLLLLKSEVMYYWVDDSRTMIC